MDQDELTAWVRLLYTPGVGRSSARKLLSAFGSPLLVLSANPRSWREVVTPSAAESLGNPPPDLPDLVRRSWDWLQFQGHESRSIITLGDDRYPIAWLEITDPPLLVYACGNTCLLQQPSVAIVGSRYPTPQGLDNARAFAEYLSDRGLTTISGLAQGIDGAAHQGSLNGPGSTIAVLGTGLDRVYPRHHLQLSREISQKGLLITEYPPGTSVLPSHFPQRNRLIAGLSRGTLVVEAALQSGSLITAKLAMEAGREVFAIPGSIHSPHSRGCHLLIKQGAKLVETGQDILEELRWHSPAPSSSSPIQNLVQQGTPNPILEAMGHDPISLESLAIRTGLPVQRLQAELLDFELAGAVKRMPGSLFQRSGLG
ncbi:MAG: DNA-processing protein DprA [Burkholderiales bacterium]|jgi:DNA processing protein